MKWKIAVSLWVGLLFILPGCDSEKTTLMILPDYVDERHMQTAASRPSDDTYGSEISTREFPEEQTTIVAIGDSLTYGVRSSAGGYPAILQAKLNEAGYTNAVVINAGIPGETSPGADKKFLNTIAGADIVLLMIGTNDICNPGGCPIPFVCNTLEQTESMLDKALISKVTPLLSTVTPAHSNGEFAWANPHIAHHNSLIAQIAAIREVIVVDNHAAIWANGGDWLSEDRRVHFTDQGYEVIARQWFDALVENGLLQKEL